MASEVLSGSSNPTYTNNTGQNVRLIINSLQACTSFSFGSSGTVNISTLSNINQNAGSIGGGIGPYTAVRTNDPLIQTNGWYTRSGGGQSNPFNNVRQLVIKVNGITVYDAGSIPTVIDGQYVIINGIKYYPSTYRGTQYGWSGDYCNAFDISLGTDIDIIRELALAPNESFSATCSAYNIVVIKEDGS